MRKLSVGTKTFSRRRFLIGSAAVAMLASTETRAADLRYRLGLSRPVDSPNYIRLKEMADNVRAETAGRMQIDIYPAGQLGSDNVMLAMLQKNEMEMYMAGNVFGPLVPVTEMPGLPYGRRADRSTRTGPAHEALRGADLSEPHQPLVVGLHADR